MESVVPIAFKKPFDNINVASSFLYGNIRQNPPPQLPLMHTVDYRALSPLLTHAEERDMRVIREPMRRLENSTKPKRNWGSK